MPTLEELEAKYFVIGAGVAHSRDTEVIPHIDGEAYFAAIYEAIAATGKSGDVIYIASWQFSPSLKLKPGVSPELGKLLHDKASAGVDVRVIAWTGRFHTGTGMLDSAEWEDSVVRWNALARAFARHAVDVVQLNIQRILELRELNQTGGRPAPPLQDRLLMDHGGGKWGSRHQKYTVVYKHETGDLRSFVGGIDFDEFRFAAPHHATGIWHDAGVELRGGAASSVWADFRTRWTEATTLPTRVFRLRDQVKLFNNPAVLNLPPVPVPPQHPVTSNNSVRVVRSYWNWKESPVVGDDLPWTTLPAEGLREVLATYSNALEKAQRFIYIEDQYLNTAERYIEHDLLYRLVLRAANRDVKVIFVVPGTGDPNDPLIKFDEQSQDLINLRIHLFRGTNFVMYRVNGVIVHSKILLVDDEFLAVGSANFADRSMTGRDTELQAAIVADGSLVRDFRVRLWADHLRVDPADPTVAGQLGDLDRSLGIFRTQWLEGTPVTFNHDNSRLERLGP